VSGRVIVRTLTALLSTATVISSAVTVSAAGSGLGGSGESGESDGGADKGFIFAAAALGGSVSSANTDSGGGSAGPVCSWQLHLGTVAEIDITGGSPNYRDAETRANVEEPGPGVQALYRVSCPSGVSFRWATPSDYVDRQALIAAAYQYMVRDIPAPELNMSPRPEVGGIVNLGLWLAVNDPGDVSAVAEVGSVWAVVTARFVGTTWDMGNGDVVNCDGLGVPYPEGSNQIAEGPCGYTYTERPPAAGYTVTATGHWEAHLLTSDGVDQMLDPIDMEFEFAYDVDEIVTTGVG